MTLAHCNRHARPNYGLGVNIRGLYDTVGSGCSGSPYPSHSCYRNSAGALCGVHAGLSGVAGARASGVAAPSMPVHCSCGGSYCAPALRAAPLPFLKTRTRAHDPHRVENRARGGVQAVPGAHTVIA